jgi:peptidoglycan/LPS O-acetylase OafA/YrhL
MGNIKLNILVKGGDNSLNCIRMIAIVMVLYSHSFILSGSTEPTPPFLDGGYGPIGLNIFFILSGFLIPQSYMRSKNAKSFIIARILRILPGLAGVLTLCVCVLGPMVTTLPLGVYITNPNTYSHLLLLSLFFGSYNLPGVFENNHFPLVVNGSLWALKYIVLFYVVVLVLGTIKLLNNKRFILSMFLLCFCLYHLKLEDSSYFFMINTVQALRLFTYFSLGILAYLYKNYIPIDILYFILCIAVLIITSFIGGLNEAVFMFVLSYIVIYIGFNKRISPYCFCKSVDISYGVFIYSFPVQQTLVHLYGGKMNPWINFSLSLSLSIGLAALSWCIFEKRAQKLKYIIVVR